MKSKINNVDLSYDVSGDGQPLLFVHGFPLSGRMWKACADRLSGSYRCIVPDLRGFGQSEATENASMGQYADDLAALLNQMGEKRPVVLIALSMGGYVALEFFRRYRPMVRAMVLCDTRPEADSPEARAKRETMIEAVQKNGAKAAADAMIDKLFATGVSPSLRQEWLEIMSTSSPAGVIAALRAMADRPDSRPTLATIDVPTLIVVGEHDAITPPDVHREMHKAISGSHFQVIAGAGHMAPVERPAEFGTALERFLATLP